MTPLVVSNLIVAGLATFGGSVFVIIGAVLTIGIAYLVFRFGWLKLVGIFGRDTSLRGENNFIQDTSRFDRAAGYIK